MRASQAIATIFSTHVEMNRQMIARRALLIFSTYVEMNRSAMFLFQMWNNFL